jgi:hypothetical protein
MSDDSLAYHGYDPDDDELARLAATPREYLRADDMDKLYPDPEAAAHDYSEGPPVEPWHGKVGTAEVIGPHEVYANPTLAVILRHLSKAPFGGLVPIDVPRVGDPNAMAKVAEWLRHYNIVIRRQSDDFTRTARELGKLKDQRAIVRDFFGIGGEDA